MADELEVIARPAASEGRPRRARAREGQVVAEGAGSSRWWSSWWRTAHQETLAAGQVDVAGGPASLCRSPMSQPGERPPRPATRRLVGWGPGPVCCVAPV